MYLFVLNEESHFLDITDYSWPKHQTNHRPDYMNTKPKVCEDCDIYNNAHIPHFQYNLSLSLGSHRVLGLSAKNPKIDLFPFQGFGKAKISLFWEPKFLAKVFFFIRRKCNFWLRLGQWFFHPTSKRLMERGNWPKFILVSLRDKCVQLIVKGRSK